MSEPVNRLMPIFLIKPGSIKPRDIRRAEKLGGVCVIECSEPEQARYSDPPLNAPLDAQANAALSLFRMILRSPDQDFKRAYMTKFFVESLIGEREPFTAPRVPVVNKK